MDLVRMGRMQALGYFMRFRTMDAKISPENRLLIGTAGGRVKGVFSGIGAHRKDSGTSNKDAKFRLKAAAVESERAVPPPAEVEAGSHAALSLTPPASLASPTPSSSETVRENAN